MKTHSTPSIQSSFQDYYWSIKNAIIYYTGLSGLLTTTFFLFCFFSSSLAVGQNHLFRLSAGNFAPNPGSTPIENMPANYPSWFSTPVMNTVPQVTLIIGGTGAVVSNVATGFDSDNSEVPACNITGSSGANKIVFPGNISEGTDAVPTNSFNIQFNNLNFVNFFNPQLRFNFNQVGGNGNPVFKVKFIVQNREYYLTTDLLASTADTWETFSFTLSDFNNPDSNTNLVTDINLVGSATLVFYRMGNNSGANENHFFAIDDISISKGQCIAGYDKVWVGRGAPGSLLTSRSFNVSANWCPAGVPTADNSVLIQANLGATLPITISSSLTVRKLTVVNSGTGTLTLQVASSTSFTVGSDGFDLPVTNTGPVTFTKSSSSATTIKFSGNFTKNTLHTTPLFGTGVNVEFNGSNFQNISSVTDLAFNNLKINSTYSGDPNVLISDGSIFMNGNLIMQQGILSTADNNLIEIRETGYLTESPDHFVRGQVKAIREVQAAANIVTDFIDLGTPVEFGGIGVFMLLPESEPAYEISVVRTRTANNFVPIVDFMGNTSSSVGYTVSLPDGRLLPTDVIFIIEYVDRDLESINPFEEENLAIYKFEDGQWLNQAFNGTNPNTTNPSNLVRDPDTNRLMLLATPNTGIFTIGNTITPLPVELIAFSAKRDADAALLQWSTATEEDNLGYHIEASSDNRTYQRIGFVAAAEIATQVNHYTFTEEQASRFGQVRYYRLVQEDLDGTKTNLGVRSVGFGGEGITVATGPNPFSEMFAATIIADSDMPVILMLTDALGRVVSRRELQLRKGANTSNFNGSQLVSGMYLLTVQLPTETITTKLAKQ